MQAFAVRFSEGAYQILSSYHSTDMNISKVDELVFQEIVQKFTTDEGEEIDDKDYPMIYKIIMNGRDKQSNPGRFWFFLSFSFLYYH